MFRDDVDEPEQRCGNGRVIRDFNLSWVNGLVPDHADNIKGPLDTRWETFPHKRSDVFVDVLAGLAKFFAKLLDCKPEQRGASPR